jgi:hypothetical protein
VGTGSEPFVSHRRQREGQMFEASKHRREARRRAKLSLADRTYEDVVRARDALYRAGGAMNDLLRDAQEFKAGSSRAWFEERAALVSDMAEEFDAIAHQLLMDDISASLGRVAPR